ncbi:hypothetical protein PHYSODRAFT_250429 [Phytophthora sojae]|uniref:Uncharacterized protein n=1 Tax=Phytophthora sojae (strain P6497) TaxID=1094619 RepID=G4Z0D8_PHYSP|nr:hypothetical protein PHYSODRAFT_250429 [Phytophthora sojae]EGZ25224.1 hypothetical protein PHYSODRAFT_250429 [Phytophthora sojae]|eukprot:XP_009520512.1 hypothetical protein PHYSODRAFT_250429 [Phytophthora sojae]
MMRLHLCATLPILLCLAATADPESYSGSGSARDNAGHDAGVVYLPAESIQHELLNTTGLVPDSLVSVTASNEALKDESPGLAGVTALNTTVYSSVLIVPAKASTATTTAVSGTHEAASADASSGHTQLTYNCTSAANLWNLQEDPSVVKLESFQQFSSNASASNSTENTREIVAVTVQNTAVGRPVLGDAFFGAEFSSDPAYFSTSTDLDSLMHSNVSATTGEGNKTRRLELGAFGFVEDPYCVYGCGEVGAAPGE